MIIYQTLHLNPYVSVGFFKYLRKAFEYFKKDGLSLKNFSFNGFTIPNGDEANLFSVLKNIPDVQTLNFRNTKLNPNNGKAIGKVLSDFKNIRELNINSAIQT